MKVVSWSPFTIAHQFHSLRGNPPDVRITSGQKLYIEFIYSTLCCKLLCDCFEYLLNRNRFDSNNTKCRKQILNRSSYETLKSSGEMELMIKFYLCSHNFFWSLKFSSLSSHGKFFWCYFRQLFISLAFRKWKKDCNILKIILVQGLCPLKTEMSRFRLNRLEKTSC